MWKLPEYTWGQERELCKRCEHYRERATGNYKSSNIPAVTTMMCALRTKSGRGKQFGSCIDMRYDGECGREGKLFKERSK